MNLLRELSTKWRPVH